MALLWIEGFEGFGTTTGVAPSPANVLARKYSAVYNEAYMHIESGRWGGYCLEFNDYQNYIHSPTALTTNGILVIGMSVYFTGLMAHEFLTLYDGATRNVNIRLTAAGELAAYRADTLLGTSTGAGIQINTWYYVEVKVYTHGSIGTVTIRVDTIQKLALTSQNTKAGSNNYSDAFRIKDEWGQYLRIDDLYCLDNSGAAPQNDFLGVKQVITVFPDAAGDDADWTPSAGSNYACVDETALDDNGTYVQSATAGQQDLYNYQNLPGAAMISGILGIQINTDVKRTQSTSYTLYQIAKRTSQSDGTGLTIANDSFLTKYRIMPLDTEGAAWTETNINATQFGLAIG